VSALSEIHRRMLERAYEHVASVHEDLYRVNRQLELLAKGDAPYPEITVGHLTVRTAVAVARMTTALEQLALVLNAGVEVPQARPPVPGGAA
jgi:hypothetical protein